MEQKTKSIKVLNLLAMIFGLCGAAFTFLSLWLPAYRVSTIVGDVNAKYYEVLHELIVIYIVIIGLTIMTSLMKTGVLSIISGSVSLIFTLFVMSTIDKNASSELSRLRTLVAVDVAFYLVIFAAILIITSGILHVVSSNIRKQVETSEDEIKADKKFKKITTIIYSSVSAVVVVGIIAFIAISSIVNSGQKKVVEQQVQKFMNAAVSGDAATVNSLVTSKPNDPSGFLEAYDPDLLVDSFIIGLGANSLGDRLTNESLGYLKDVAVTFGNDYVESYKIQSIDYDSATDTAVVTVDVVMYNEKGASSVDITSGVSDLTNSYMKHNSSVVESVYKYSGEKAAWGKVLNGIMKDAAPLLTESFKSQGVIDATLTLKLENVNGTYLISSINN